MMNLMDTIRSQCGDVPASLVDMHFRRMPPSYFERHSAAEVARHLKLLAHVTADSSVHVEIRPLASHAFEILVVGIDHAGTVACITAALAAHGFDLEDLQVASYFSNEHEARRAGEPDLFVVVLRMSGDMQGRSLHELADELTERLQVAFQLLGQGKFPEAQRLAADTHADSLDITRKTPARAAPKATVTDHTGLILGGDFRLQQKLAVGGMSEVYLANQASLNRIVVVKLIRHQSGTDDDLLARFYKEGMVLGQFTCPVIVQILAAGAVPGRGGKLGWMAMEYMAGGDLARWQREYGVPSMDLATRWLRQALEGLQYAHRRNILHRDIKPHNLLLTSEGHLKVSDFGLLKQVEHVATGLTPHEAIVGTPHYMSPEQALGEPLDERSDLFSLGTTFFHLLSGRLPFEKTSATAVLVQISQEDAPRLRDQAALVPTPLALMIERMMARRREERYQDAGVILEDLASYERRGLLQFPDSSAFIPVAPPPGVIAAEATRAYQPAPAAIDDVVI